MTSRSIAQVYDTTVTPLTDLLQEPVRPHLAQRDARPPTTAPPRLTSSPDW